MDTNFTPAQAKMIASGYETALRESRRNGKDITAQDADWLARIDQVTTDANEAFAAARESGVIFTMPRLRTGAAMTPEQEACKSAMDEIKARKNAGIDAVYAEILAALDARS